MFLSDEGPSYKMLNFAFYIGSTPTCFELYLNTPSNTIHLFPTSGLLRFNVQRFAEISHLCTPISFKLIIPISSTSEDILYNEFLHMKFHFLVLRSLQYIPSFRWRLTDQYIYVIVTYA